MIPTSEAVSLVSRSESLATRDYISFSSALLPTFVKDWNSMYTGENVSFADEA